MTPFEAQRLRSEIEACRKNAEQERAAGYLGDAQKWDRRAEQLQKQLEAG